MYKNLDNFCTFYGRGDNTQSYKSTSTTLL